MLLAYLCCKIQLIYLDFMPVVSLYNNWKSIYQPSNLCGYFVLLSNAFFLIPHVLSLSKIDYRTIKSLLMQGFIETNNPVAYSTLSNFYLPILAIAGVKTRHCP